MFKNETKVKNYNNIDEEIENALNEYLNDPDKDKNSLDAYAAINSLKERFCDNI